LFVCASVVGFYWGALLTVEKTPLAFPCPSILHTHTGSELVYCTLSLTSKLYLGIFLLINVIYVDGSVEEALAPAS
tara:strand:+ start:935 stop:1162 length:228 start_codon:yes stop_codon:yes gene_type:complete